MIYFEQFETANENVAADGPRDDDENSTADAASDYADVVFGATYKPQEILELIGKRSKSRCSARAVLIALASFVRFSGRESGTCWPSLATLAQAANVTKRTVQRCIEKLVELGELKVIQKGRPGRSARYRLMILNASAKLSPRCRQKRPSNSFPRREGKEQRPRRLSSAVRAANRRDLSKPSRTLPLSSATGTEVESKVDKSLIVPQAHIDDALLRSDPQHWEVLLKRARRMEIPSANMLATVTKWWRAQQIMDGKPIVTIDHTLRRERNLRPQM